MAKREKRKTSLGNILDGDAASEKSSPPPSAPPTNNRWRSKSDGGGHRPRPRLFRSVREAMEYEAAQDLEEASAPILRRQDLSALEETQADEAGYTVIRRRPVSDLTASRSRDNTRQAPPNRGGQRHQRGGRNPGRTTTTTTRKHKNQTQTFKQARASVNPWSAEQEHSAAFLASQVNDDGNAHAPPSLAWEGAWSTPATVPPPEEPTQSTALDDSMLSWLESTLTREKSSSNFALPHDETVEAP